MINMKYMTGTVFIDGNFKMFQSLTYILEIAQINYKDNLYIHYPELRYINQITNIQNNFLI